jgi:dUTP pyrophosphatase
MRKGKENKMNKVKLNEFVDVVAESHGLGKNSKELTNEEIELLLVSEEKVTTSNFAIKKCVCYVNPTIRCKKLSENATVPTRAKAGDAGSDLYASEEAVVPAKRSAVIKTDIAVEIPYGHVGLVWSRSGLSVNNGLEVGAGCIDAGYRGEVRVHLHNHSNNSFKFIKGNKIAQMLVVPVNLCDFEAIGPDEELSVSDRGDGGFGSTGL